MFDEQQYIETVYGSVPCEVWTAYRARQAAADLTEDGEPITDIQMPTEFR